jgi:hypothetical protein
MAFGKSTPHEAGHFRPYMPLPTDERTRNPVEYLLRGQPFISRESAVQRFENRAGLLLPLLFPLRPSPNWWPYYPPVMARVACEDSHGHDKEEKYEKGTNPAHLSSPPRFPENSVQHTLRPPDQKPLRNQPRKRRSDISRKRDFIQCRRARGPYPICLTKNLDSQALRPRRFCQSVTAPFCQIRDPDLINPNARPRRVSACNGVNFP